jgi:hypothetical protein
MPTRVLDNRSGYRQASWNGSCAAKAIIEIRAKAAPLDLKAIASERDQ